MKIVRVVRSYHTVYDRLMYIIEDYLPKQNVLSVPRIEFLTSVKLDPRQRIERHGLEVSFSAGATSVDADVLVHILKVIKKNTASATKQQPTSPVSPPVSETLPLSPPNSGLSPPASPPPTRVGWASPLSPTSPLMGALSVSSEALNHIRHS